MNKDTFDVFAQYGVIGVMLLMFAWYHFKYSAKRFDDQDKRVETQNATLGKLIETVDKMNTNALLNQKSYEARTEHMEDIIKETCGLIRETRETVLIQNELTKSLIAENKGMREFINLGKSRRNSDSYGVE